MVRRTKKFLTWIFPLPTIELCSAAKAVRRGADRSVLATFSVVVCVGVFVLGQGSATTVGAWVGFQAVLILIALAF